MKTSGVIALVLAVAAVAAIGIVMIGFSHSQDANIPEGSSPIHYHLNGGTLPEGYINYYYPDEYTELPEPRKNGMTFSGWFRDRDMSIPVGALLGSDTGTVDLYAGWMESMVGHYITMGFSDSTSLMYVGKATWKYMAADSDGNYYIERTIRTTGMLNGGSTSTKGYWSDDAAESSNFKYTGNQTVRWGNTDYRCQVWQAANGEAQWIYNNNIPIRIISIADGMRITYVIQDYGSFEADPSMRVSVVADVGSGVSGSLNTEIGKRVTLSATGDFQGWYRDGKLVSDTRDLTIGRATPGESYELRGSEDYIEINSLAVNTEELGLYGAVLITNSSGTVYSHDGGDLTFLVSGYFTISDSSSPITKQVRIHINVSYGITYVLNGGTLPEGAAESYSFGTYTDLPIPTNGNRYFEGWYSDEGCTIPFGAIMKSTSGDITVYAAWSEPKVGSGFTMNYQYTPRIIINNNGIINGTVTWKYVAMDSKANYYVERTRDIDGNTSTAGYWTDEPDDSVFTYIGNQTVTWNGTDYLCEVWQSTSGEKQWLYRSYLPLMITAYTTGGTVTYTIADTISFDPSAYAQIEVVADYGLEIIGADRIPEVGSTVELTAVGDEFYAWYADGKLITNDKVLVIDRVTPDVRYEARSSSEYIMIESDVVNASSYGLTGAVTITYEDGTSKTFSSGFVTMERPGYAVIVDSGFPVSMQIRVFADLEGTFAAHWEFNGVEYDYSMTMRYSDVFAYTQNDKYSDRKDHKTDELVNRYFTTDDKYVKQISEYLLEMRDKGNMSDTAFAGFVMRFVQSIPYIEDMKSRQADEFWKYPAEYLWDGGGDCEDSSILYATLMYVMGYDSGIIVFYNHAMAVISLDTDTSGYKNVMDIDGRKYIFVETTDAYITDSDPDGYQLGDSYGTSYSPSTVQYYYLVSESQ